MAMSANERHAKHKLKPRGRAYELWRHAKRRSDKRGAQITVTVEQIAKIISEGKCQLTGLPFDLSPPKSTRHNPYAPSIDRIDSSNFDYTPENVRIVLCWVNLALNEFGLSASLPIIKALAKCE